MSCSQGQTRASVYKSVGPRVDTKIYIFANIVKTSHFRENISYREFAPIWHENLLQKFSKIQIFSRTFSRKQIFLRKSAKLGP
jgi:hypothetical protein